MDVFNEVILERSLKGVRLVSRSCRWPFLKRVGMDRERDVLLADGCQGESSRERCRMLRQMFI
jgi:hypothetical protein